MVLTPYPSDACYRNPNQCYCYPVCEGPELKSLVPFLYDCKISVGRLFSLKSILGGSSSAVMQVVVLLKLNNWELMKAHYLTAFEGFIVEGRVKCQQRALKK